MHRQVYITVFSCEKRKKFSLTGGGKTTIMQPDFIKPLSKRSRRAEDGKESRGWCDRGTSSPIEWTCEGKPKAAGK